MQLAKYDVVANRFKRHATPRPAASIGPAELRELLPGTAFVLVDGEHRLTDVLGDGALIGPTSHMASGSRSCSTDSTRSPAPRRSSSASRRWPRTTSRRPCGW